MAAVSDSIPHLVRTADDPRAKGLHRALISRVELVNRNIRVVRLSLPDGPVRHLPGQYVDLHIPEVETVGGFTITSPPQTALALPSNQHARPENQLDPYPFLELAIQRSAHNPPAAYLYRPPPEILDTLVSVRIGGSFTYPPSTLSLSEFRKIDNVLFIAGGVGINPIVSMVSAMDILGNGRPGGMLNRVRILYSSRREQIEPQKKDENRETYEDDEVLFEKRLKNLVRKWQSRTDVDLQYWFYETSSATSPTTRTSNNDGSVTEETSLLDNDKFQHVYRRMTQEDVLNALGPADRRPSTLVYVCGLPTMTDQYIDFLKKTKGLEKNRILFEKWW